MSQLEDKAINYERMAKSLKYIKLYIDKFKSGEIDETKLKEQINAVAEENGYVTKDKLNLETINDVNIDDTITGDFVALVKTKNGWTNENLEVQEYTKEELLEKLGLTTEDIETITNILTDSSVVSTTKTWNSSAIYTELKNTKEECNDYTLKQIAKTKKISYKIVSTKDEMTDTTLIYLMLDSATNKYDMYVKDSVDSEPTKIGNTDIDLTNYVLLNELETKYYTKEDCDTKFASITELDKKVEKVEGKSLVLDTEIEKIHFHNNKEQLDKITEDTEGNILYNGKKINEESIKIHKKNTSVTTAVYQWFVARYNTQTKQVSTTIPITIANDVSNVSLDFGDKGILLHSGSSEVEQFPTQVSVVGIEDSKSLGLLRFDITVDSGDTSINCIAIPAGTTITFS